MLDSTRLKSGPTLSDTDIILRAVAVCRTKSQTNSVYSRE